MFKNFQNPPWTLFESLDSFDAIQKLIDEGQAENLYLECKSPEGPVVGQDIKSKLAKATSGFSNTAGGIIVWGVSTTKQQGGLDVLTQIESIGSIKKFEQAINLSILTLVNPGVDFKSKILLEKVGNTKGILITYVAQKEGDPVQALDGNLYLRSRDEFVEMPYETIKRMFLGATSPDLFPIFDKRLVKLDKVDGSWDIPVGIQNLSSAVAKDVKVTITFKNFSSCESVSSAVFKDISHINPNKNIFSADNNSPIYRGLNLIVGSLKIKMKKEKRAKRILNLEITIYATSMRARKCFVSVQLAQNGFSIKKTAEEYLY